MKNLSGNSDRKTLDTVHFKLSHTVRRQTDRHTQKDECVSRHVRLKLSYWPAAANAPGALRSSGWRGKACASANPKTNAPGTTSRP